MKSLPTNDTAIIQPLDPSTMDLNKAEGFGLKSTKADAPEEAIRWRVVQAGPGNYSSNGQLVPNPLRSGMTIVFLSVNNKTLRESWARSTQLLEGQRYLTIRGFASENPVAIVEEGFPK
jgi:hypothetical protein